MSLLNFALLISPIAAIGALAMLFVVIAVH